MTDFTAVITLHFFLLSLTADTAVIGLMSELSAVVALNTSQAVIISLATWALFRPMASASAVETSIARRWLVISLFVNFVVVIIDSSLEALSGDMSYLVAVVALH